MNPKQEILDTPLLLLFILFYLHGQAHMGPIWNPVAVPIRVPIWSYRLLMDNDHLPASMVSIILTNIFESQFLYYDPDMLYSLNTSVPPFCLFLHLYNGGVKAKVMYWGP